MGPLNVVYPLTEGVIITARITPARDGQEDVSVKTQMLTKQPMGSFKVAVTNWSIVFWIKWKSYFKSERSIVYAKL